LDLFSRNLPGAAAPDLEVLGRAKDWVNRLSQMTAQLLDISRLEAGQMPLHRQARELAHTAGTAIESVAAFARKPARCVTLSGSAVAFYDAEIVRRMVENLLINALKFSPDETEIRIEITREGDMARVAVCDDGPGIPPQHQQRIFEKFAQVKPMHRRFGAGVGLAFCKLAAEAHGGQIGVTSQPGQGSVFWFTLPTGE
jgi:signal transduction histidine kinase